MSATGGSPAPNWYPDPTDRGLLRYWDGSRWTAHTAPVASQQAAASAATDGGSKKGVWVAVIVGGSLLLIVVIGILAAIAIPVYLSQREKAADTSAKYDAATLGKEIATWYVDNDGQPPAVTVSGGWYSVDHVRVAPASANVEFGGVTGSGALDWCVWVTNPQGAMRDYQYSAAGGLESGTCGAPGD